MRIKHCRYCGAEIYWANVYGRWKPVDTQTVPYTAGRGGVVWHRQRGAVDVRDCHPFPGFMHPYHPCAYLEATAWDSPKVLAELVNGAPENPRRRRRSA